MQGSVLFCKKRQREVEKHVGPVCRIKELYEKLGKRYTGSENVRNFFMEDE